MVKLDVKAIGLTSAIITAIIYIACFLIVLIFGASSLKFFSLFIHGIDLTSLATNPNLGTGVLGLIISVIVAYILGALFALTYNKYSK